MVRKHPAEIDPLLEPLLLQTSDEQADEFLMQLIALHAESVIKGIIYYKLHLHSHQAAGQADGAAGQAAQDAGQAAGGENGSEGPRATNAAQRRAEEMGIDLSTLKGSGAGGLITVKDVVKS